MNAFTPPQWAEALLRTLLAPRDRETVSGDLLEEYRERVRATRGRRRADRWYLWQVAGFAWRSPLAWAIALSALYIGRTILDVLMPTMDFQARAAASTYLSASVLFSAGASATWRSRSILASAIAGACASLIAAAFDVTASAVILVFFHDQSTLAAIAASGGLTEVFALPLVIVVPAVVIGAAGGVTAHSGRRMRDLAGG